MHNIDKEYIDYIAEFISSEPVKEMKNYIQHGSTSTYLHCLKVSYYSYLVAKKFGLNARACAIGGLLHDFFLYDWHNGDWEGKKDFFLPHGFTHGVVAERNAKKFFDIDNICSDIIIKHMFPLTIWKIPRYPESYVVLMVDKYLSTIEVFKRKKRKGIETKAVLNNRP